jgi:anti-sigma B factor antagonist
VRPIASPGQLGMSERVEGARRVISLTGELDMAGAPALEARVGELCADAPEVLVIDLSGLTFIDSTGLRTLLSAQSMCDAQACDLSLVQGPENVQRLFALTGLLDHLPFQ